jgi:hypothetical protein
MEKEWIKDCLRVYRGYGIEIVVTNTEKGRRIAYQGFETRQQE